MSARKRQEVRSTPPVAAPPAFHPVDHEAERLDPAPLIALRQVADQLDGARRRVAHLEEARRSQIDRALSYGIPAIRVAKAARISRSRLYKAFPNEVAGSRQTRQGGPPAPEAGTERSEA